MTYKVKEIFYTLQGEGTHAGRPAVFCRFSSCNLWTGREADRERAICKFCDTDFVGTDGEGGGKFADAEALADAVAAKWPAERRRATDGRLHGRRAASAVGRRRPSRPSRPGASTSPSRPTGRSQPPPGIDWLCVSPKIGSELVVDKGHELKFVFPQGGVDPTTFEHLDFESFRVQPMDGPDVAANTELAVKFCLDHPRWQLSLQTHKYLGIP